MDTLFLAVLGLILGLCFWSSRRSVDRRKKLYPCIKESDGWYGVQKNSTAFYDMRPGGEMNSWNTNEYVRKFCLTPSKEVAERVLAEVQEELFKSELVERLRLAP